MAKIKVKKGTKISEDCIDSANNSLSLFSQDELREYVSDIFERSKSEKYKDLPGQQALKLASQEIGNEELESLIQSCATQARNIGKLEILNKLIKEGKTLRQLIIPTLNNKDYNIERSQYAARNELFNDFHGSLSKEEISFLEHADQRTQQLIGDAADGKEVNDPMIKKIGELIRDYPTKLRNPRLILSDALSMEEINNDRMLRNIHNPTLLSNAGQSIIRRVLSKEKVNSESPRKVWVDDLLKYIDKGKTAKNLNALDLDGNVIDSNLNRSLEKMYDNIIQQKSDISTKSSLVNDLESLRRKQRMYLVFKDWRSQIEYNQKYGQGTLYQAIQADIHSSGNKIGISQIMGSSPTNTFNTIRNTIKELPNKPGSLKTLEAENLFKQVAGIDQTAYSLKLANVGSAVRAFSTMARLGSLALNSLGDIGQVAAISQRFGYGYWGSYVNAISHAFNIFPNEDRIKLSQDMRSSLNTHMGYLGKWADTSSFNDVASKMSNTFFWLNFMTAWDKGLKLSGMEWIGRGLGRDSVKEFGELNQQTQFQLSKFNISPGEWDVLRSKTKNNLFTLDNIQNLSDDEVRKAYDQSDKLTTYSDYRSHLYRKVFGLFDTTVENSVLDPRTYERMCSSAGLQSGTPTGELARAFMQFKSYPISNFRRVWYAGMSEMDGAQAKIMYAFNMFAGTYMLSYLSMVVGDLATGKSARSFNDLTYKDHISLLAPGLGTFLKVLNKNNQDPKMILSLLATPSVHLITDPFAASIALLTGNTKEAKKDAKDFLNYANPIGTIPIAQPYLDSLFGNKAYIAPGQHQLFGG